MYVKKASLLYIKPYFIVMNYSLASYMSTWLLSSHLDKPPPVRMTSGEHR